jgi:hypothetical protein
MEVEIEVGIMGRLFSSRRGEVMSGTTIIDAGFVTVSVVVKSLSAISKATIAPSDMGMERGVVGEGGDNEVSSFARNLESRPEAESGVVGVVGAVIGVAAVASAMEGP